jgi:ferrous iron transport protein B
VLDASNLERNLRLALEIRRRDLPVIYVLNLLDIAERHGITVNAQILSQELNAPVIETVAVKNQGLSELREELARMLKPIDGGNAAQKPNLCKSCRGCGKDTFADDCRTAKEIARRVSSKKSAQAGFMDRLGDAMTRPLTGIPIAFTVMAALIGVVVGGGELLREFLLYPLVDGAIVPFFRMIFTSFIAEGILLNILVGEFGIFVISFQWIIALILPYVFLFYAAFSFLEDSGYMPRLSVLFDNVMRKLGAQGGSLIYIMMGFGCAAPAIIGTRAATSRKERLVITAVICFAVPCISQTGALASLLSAHSWWLFPAMIAFGFVLFVSAALIAGRLLKGKVDPLMLEIPNLLIPTPRAYGRKLLIRMRHFLVEAEVPMLAAVVLAAVLFESGLLNTIAVHAGPFMSRWLGMPDEAVIALILGIIRREMSVAPLLALELTSLQAFVGGAVSLMYLPCLSVFAILVKEFKLRIALTIAVLSVFLALFVGGIINHVGQFAGWLA